MSRYIDADAFLAYEIKRCDNSMPYVGCCTTTNNILQSELERFPTADVVEVVRCKDCKHSTEFEYYADADNPFCDYHWASVAREWFCWNGERRGGAE